MKALLQQLAVLGRNLPLSLVREVLPQADDERYRLLSTLQRKEFRYEQPAFSEVEWQQRDDTTAARNLLAPIHDWFTEGFATNDLQKAKVLLEELSIARNA